MTNQTYTVNVNLQQKTETNKGPEKLHSRVFECAKDVVDPITRSVYLNRPMSNGHTKAKITVEFLD